jgi:glucokinase
MTRWAVGVDLGNTRLSVGLVSEKGALECLSRRPTPRAEGAGATVELLRRMIAAVLAQKAGREVCGIGIGFGGPVDWGTQRCRMSHHAPGWEDLRLAEALEPDFDLPVVVENDANAGGLGEALFGAGSGFADVLYVNIGTGVGGAVIIGGRIHHGAHSNAGEFGHMVIDPSGPECTCGKRGCVEAFCSGDAIGFDARASHAAGAFADVDEGQISGKWVGERAASGDAEALRVIDKSARRMGFALGMCATLLDPGIIVLGGGVPELGELYLAPVRTAFSEYAMDIPAAQTCVVAAHLGYNAGIIGAGAVLLTAQAPTRFSPQ